MADKRSGRSGFAAGIFLIVLVAAIFAVLLLLVSQFVGLSAR
jgi:hypothetical protein